MKSILAESILIAFFLLFCGLSFGQNGQQGPVSELVSGPKTVIPEVKTVNGELVYEAVDKPAEFPGGFAALNHWLSENMMYPQDALEYSLQGKCYVEFVVGEDGVSRHFKLLRGVRDCSSCDLEALRLVKQMPKWNPALRDNKPTETRIHVAITFKLN